MGTSKVVKVRRVEFPDWQHSHVEHALLTCTSLKHVPKMQAVPQGLSLPNTYSSNMNINMALGVACALL